MSLAMVMVCRWEGRERSWRESVQGEVVNGEGVVSERERERGR